MSRLPLPGTGIRSWSVYERIEEDRFVKGPQTLVFVIPAKAGIQEYQGLLDPGLRRGDDCDDFLRFPQGRSSKTSELWRGGLNSSPWY